MVDSNLLGSAEI